MPQIIDCLLIFGGTRKIPGSGVGERIKVVGPTVAIGVRQASANAETNRVGHQVLVRCRIPVIGNHVVVKLGRQVGVVVILGDIGHQDVFAVDSAAITVKITARLARIRASPEPVCEQDGKVLLAGLDDRRRLPGHVARKIVTDFFHRPSQAGTAAPGDCVILIVYDQLRIMGREVRGTRARHRDEEV